MPVAAALVTHEIGYIVPGVMVTRAKDSADFDWERDYGKLYRACPTAFWLAPEPGDRKRDVIDVRAMGKAQRAAHAAANMAYRNEEAASAYQASLSQWRPGEYRPLPSDCFQSIGNAAFLGLL